MVHRISSRLRLNDKFENTTLEKNRDICDKNDNMLWICQEEDLESHEIFVNKVIEGSLTFVDANCSMSSARSVRCCSDRRRCHSCERVFTELYFPTTGPEGGRALKLHRRPATGNTTTFVAIEPPPHKRQNKNQRIRRGWCSTENPSPTLGTKSENERLASTIIVRRSSKHLVECACWLWRPSGKGAERTPPRVHDTCTPHSTA